MRSGSSSLITTWSKSGRSASVIVETIRARASVRLDLALERCSMGRPLLLVVLSGDLALQVLHAPGFAQRRDVAQLAALGDVPQQSAHDLAGARLRQVRRPDHLLRARELADPLRDVRADLLLEVLVALRAVAFEGHERDDGLAGVLVLLADHSALGDRLER